MALLDGDLFIPVPHSWQTIHAPQQPRKRPAGSGLFQPDFSAARFSASRSRLLFKMLRRYSTGSLPAACASSSISVSSHIRRYGYVPPNATTAPIPGVWGECRFYIVIGDRFQVGRVIHRLQQKCRRPRLLSFLEWRTSNDRLTSQWHVSRLRGNPSSPIPIFTW